MGIYSSLCHFSQLHHSQGKSPLTASFLEQVFPLNPRGVLRPEGVWMAHTQPWFKGLQFTVIQSIDYARGLKRIAGLSQNRCESKHLCFFYWKYQIYVQRNFIIVTAKLIKNWFKWWWLSGSQRLCIRWKLMVISISHFLHTCLLNEWFNKYVLQSMRGIWDGNAKSYGTGHACPWVVKTKVADWQVNVIRMCFHKQFDKNCVLGIGTQGEGVYIIQSWEGEVVESFMEMRLGWILRKCSFIQ